MTHAIEKTDSRGSTTAKIPFRLKVKAWWQGVELEACPKDQDSSPDETEEASGAARGSGPEKKPWETDRVTLLQALWGSGFSSPGDEKTVLKFLEPFGLAPRMTVLDLGAGLGSATRAMAKSFGVRATGLESDESLARAGMELSKGAKLSATAPVKVLGAEEFQSRPKAFDCIFSKEFIFAVRNKFGLFNALEESLTDRGQLQIIDYVLSREDLKSAWLDQWIKLDRNTPSPWTLNRYTETFESFGLRILISEDISDDVYKIVSESLARYMTQIRDTRQDPKMLGVMAREIHIWESRMRLLKEKDLRVFRFHTAKRSNTLRSSSWQ